MPLVFNNEIENSKAKLGVWEIQESVDFLLESTNLTEMEKILQLAHLTLAPNSTKVSIKTAV